MYRAYLKMLLCTHLLKEKIDTGRLQGDHLDDSCIKMNSDESHFNVSLTVRDRSQDSVHRPQHLKTKESRSGELNRRRPLQYQPDAFPPDQTSSPGLYERALDATGKGHGNGTYTWCYRHGTWEWNVHLMLQAWDMGMERTLDATGMGHGNGTYTWCYRHGTWEWNVHLMLQAWDMGMERTLDATGMGHGNGTYTWCYRQGTWEWNVHLMLQAWDMGMQRTLDATGMEHWNGTATKQSGLPHSPVSGFRPADRLVKDLQPWTFLCS